jgi:hypothetical protein
MRRRFVNSQIRKLVNAVWYASRARDLFMSETVSPEMLIQIARYAHLSLDHERVALLARLLAPALARLHAIHADDYQQLAPSVTFRVPPPPVRPGR